MSRESAEAYNDGMQILGWMMIAACALILLWVALELWTHRRKR